MIQSSRLEKDKKDNIIKDVRNVFELKREKDDTIIEDIKNVLD